MKKISLMLLFACAFLQSQAQDLKFTIKGKTEIVPNKNKITFVRYDLANGQRIDTLKVNPQGEFTFTATVPDIQIGQIVYYVGNDSRSEVFYLQSGVIHINISKGKRFAELSGTPLNKDFNDYYVMMDHLLDSANAADHPARDYYQFSKEIKIPKLHLMQQFVPVHPNSLVSLYELNTITRFPDEVADLAKLYNQLTPELQKTKEGKEMASLIKGLGSNKIGDVALDFSLPDSTGKVIKLTDFRGKYILLDFWATWCTPCLEEMPNVIDAYQKYHDKNFEIVGVSLDRPDSKALWERMIKEKNMNWVQISDLKWWNSEAALLYNVQGVPANFLIDPNGKIIDVNLRGPHLQQKLNEIFNQPPGK